MMPDQDVILCCTRNGTKTWEQFANDISVFQEKIAAASHLLNLFEDRYEFMVGLGAAFLNNQTTILPSSKAIGAIDAAMRGLPSPLILGKEDSNKESFGELCSAAIAEASSHSADLLQLFEHTTGEVHVFTSGSTMQPVRHRKNWDALVGGAKLTKEILSELECYPGSCGIIGTTPHQHMYGLEATIFACLAYSYCVYSGTVFYHADLEQAVATLQSAGFNRCVLVTSPAHLKFLETTILANPEICGVVSASAPLSIAQAKRLESQGSTTVWEIYGTTETGSLAKRRTALTEEWEPLGGFSLKEESDGFVASAPHLSEKVLLGDALELISEKRFRLLGRLGDLVNVAGKRANLASLNTILLETPGILDGLVTTHRSGSDDVISVIAKIDDTSSHGKENAKDAIRQQFRKYVDPIFLPKSIRFVKNIPRTETGKISFEDLADMQRKTNLNRDQ